MQQLEKDDDICASGRGHDFQVLANRNRHGGQGGTIATKWCRYCGGLVEHAIEDGRVVGALDDIELPMLLKAGVT